MRDGGRKGYVGSPIEDYALIGDREGAALVARDGSVDWFCAPRFDSPACMAALLGDRDNGRFRLAPAEPIERVARRYRGETMILETEQTCASGTVRIVDLMSADLGHHSIVRRVEGVAGRVPMEMDLVLRMDYGRLVPWVRRLDGTLSAVSGPDALYLHADVATRGTGRSTEARFSVGEGEVVDFVLTWEPSIDPAPERIDAGAVIERTERWWSDWATRLSYEGEWSSAVRRSLVTLKALTYGPTGGIVAAATTSLPELIGGSRNWDYRFCWLRDATFTLNALMDAGCIGEARAWRDWLLRSAAGSPNQLQMLYGVAGEPRLPEVELPWLAGYEGSAPVRVGNAAADQLQLDVYGELMDSMHRAREEGIEPDEHAWELQRALVEEVETIWSEADEGIWEIRSERRHFTHSKVMAWVALDRAVKSVELFGLPGERDRWACAREEVRAEILDKGYDRGRGSFTRAFDGDDLDASLLVIPLVGFLPADDERVVGTVEAVRRELADGCFVWRYEAGPEADGLAGSEGAFLACSFWLVDNLALMGRVEEARELFCGLLDVANDVDLLAEEYDVERRRQVGNFPQALSHIGLVNSACRLGSARG